MNFDVLPTATINFGRVNVRSNDDANNSLVCEADNHPQTFAFTCPESVSSGRFASASYGFSQRELPGGGPDDSNLFRLSDQARATTIQASE